jgi:ATP-dependent protease HslVU (ClpYQ) peptidase subunit
MNGRRSHARVVVANNEAVLQVARDVTVISTDADLVAICSEALSAGDALTIEIVVDGQVDRIAVRVKESRPIVVAGTIRHRIRLMRIDSDGQATEGDTRIRRSEWKTDRDLRVVRRETSLPD